MGSPLLTKAKHNASTLVTDLVIAAATAAALILALFSNTPW